MSNVSYANQVESDLQEFASRSSWRNMGRKFCRKSAKKSLEITRRTTKLSFARNERKLERPVGRSVTEGDRL